MPSYTTKLRLHQLAWFLHNNQAIYGEVGVIVLKENIEGITITYTISYGNVTLNIPEECCFATKQELLDSL